MTYEGSTPGRRRKRYRDPQSGSLTDSLKESPQSPRDVNITTDVRSVIGAPDSFTRQALA